MISFKATLGFMFLALVATIAVLAVISYQTNKDIAAGSSRVSHTHEIIEKAEEISSAYKDARLAVNAMIIRRDTSRNAAYTASVKVLPVYVQEVRQLTSDNNQQQININSLEKGLMDFKIISDSLISMVISAVPNETIVNLHSHSMPLRDRITFRIETIKSAEKALLEQREIKYRENAAAFNRAFNSLLAGTILLLGATFMVIRHYFNKRIRMEDELTRTKMLFEKVFYESPIAIVISDIDTGEILNCNNVFAATVNFDPSELIGRTAAELGIFESQDKRKETVSATKQSDMSHDAEVYIKPRARDPIYVSIHAHVIPLYDRKCLLTAILDLTTHKRAEDEIMKAFQTEKELSRLKSNFVTLASHEFKTPLTTILSSAFLLEKYSFGDNQQKAAKHVARIKSTVNNLVSVLDEFLSVSKIEEGHVQANVEKVDLPKYINGICKNLQTFAKPGQTIYYSHSGKSDVNADPVLLANILNNLVSNSIKYSNEDSPIHVMSLVNSKIHLSVKDNGIGIPEEDQKHLFERFYRASNAGTVQGTGLGLHIMKHYVEMMNGSINVKSTEGKGTEVSVTFDNIQPVNIESSPVVAT